MENAVISQMIAEWEGGYSNSPADSGGPTKYGITQADLTGWLGRHASAQDVQNMGLDTAIKIYRAKYWAPGHLDLLPDALQPAVFNMMVNCGLHTGAAHLQRVLTWLGGSLSVDGVIGRDTAQAVVEVIAAHGAPAVVNAFCDDWDTLYDSIAAAHPRDREFLRGWHRRADSFRVPA